MMKLPGTLAFTILVWCGCGLAQSTEGVRVFEQTCTTCHGKAQIPPIPDPTALRQMTPESVYQALNTSAAHQKLQLTDDVKRAVAEFASGRNMMPDDAGEAKRMPNVCPSNPPITSLTATPAWNGWGVDATNGRFQPAKSAGLSKAQVPSLKLKWAFGFPGATAVHGQPSVAAGRVFVGLNNGYVYSLDAATGCVYWSFQARSGVRNAISIGEIKDQGSARYAVYFGDGRANVYALDAATGKLLWKFDSGIDGTQPARGVTYWTDGKQSRIFAGVMVLSRFP